MFLFRRSTALAAFATAAVLPTLGTAGTAYADTTGAEVVTALPAGMTVLPADFDLSTVDTGATEEGVIITVTKPAGICETYQTFTILTVNDPLSPTNKLVILSAAVPTSETIC